MPRTLSGNYVFSTGPGQQGEGPGCFQRRGPSDQNPGAWSREEPKGQRAAASSTEQAHSKCFLWPGKGKQSRAACLVWTEFILNVSVKVQMSRNFNVLMSICRQRNSLKCVWRTCSSAWTNQRATSKAFRTTLIFWRTLTGQCLMKDKYQALDRHIFRNENEILCVCVCLQWMKPEFFPRQVEDF